MNDPITIDDLEKRLQNNKSLFLNKQWVKPSYMNIKLEDIYHRNEEILKLFDYLNEVFNNRSPSPVFIYGKPGLGKTVMTTKVLEKIKEMLDNRNKEMCIIYMRCAKKSGYWIIKNINDNIPSPPDLKKNNINSLSAQIDYMNQLVDNYAGIIIIVLDELDKNNDPKIINEIIRTISKLSGQNPCIIAITNNADVEKDFDNSPDLKSVLADNKLPIHAYDAEKLQDILTARAKKAFKSNVLDEMVIPLVAALSAQEHGDVRKALDLLRVAGEIAEKNKKDIVEENDVRAAKEKIEMDTIIDYVRDLPTQSKVSLLACITCRLMNKEMSVSAIHLVYSKMCTILDLDVLTQRRIADLLDELDQLGIIQGTNISKGRHGRKKTITNIVSPIKIKEILYEDYRLKPLKDINLNEYYYNKIFK